MRKRIQDFATIAFIFRKKRKKEKKEKKGKKK
jgi:hypothetical protein